MILSINLPTNNPNNYFNILEPSLINLESLLDFCAVQFSFVFQTPWTLGEINRAEKKLISKGFEIQEGVALAVKNPSMTCLRNIGIMNSPKADYYLIADDNFEFRSGTPKYPYDSGIRYSQCLQYLNEYPNCGFVMCEGSLGGSVQKMKISSTKVGLFATTRGLILRNIGPKKIYRQTSHLLGGLEESVACYHIMEKGFFPAKQFNNPTINKDMKKPNCGNFIHDEEVWEENCAKYIKERYNDLDWSYQKKKLPKGLIKCFTANGGSKEILKNRIFEMDF